MQQQIGKFEIVQKLGEGGMGVVYKAFDPFVERFVALKTLTAELATNPDVQERFKREFRAVGQLAHRNIVVVYEVFQEAGQFYMVMEYLEGRGLDLEISSGRRMPLEERLRVMLEVLDGLAYAHDKGIIHRDIKPANVLLTTERQVKLLDFGLARLAASHFTKTNANAMGTPYYMSPEQWLSETVTEASDVFSCGVMLYELLTGKRPFESHSAAAIGFQVIHKRQAPVDHVVPELPADLAGIVDRALAKEPKERFGTAHEFAEALQDFREGLSERTNTLQQQLNTASVQLDESIRGHRDVALSELAEEILRADAADPASSRLLATLNRDGDESKTIITHPLSFLEIARELSALKGISDRFDRLVGEVEELDGLLAQARERELRDDVVSALATLDRALERFPEVATVRAEHDRLRSQVAERERSRAVSRYLEEATVSFERGELDEALSKVQRAKELDPAREDALALSRRIREAIVQVERARTDAKALLDEASKALEADDASRCLDIVAKALGILPDAPGAEELRRRAHVRIREQREELERKKAVREALESAERDLETDDFAGARKWIARAREHDPEASGASSLLSLVAKREKEHELLERMLEEAHRLFREGDLDAANGRVTGVLARRADHSRARELKRRIDDRRAEEEREERQRQAHITDVLSRAHELETTGALEGALDAATEVLTLDEDNAEAIALRDRVEAKLDEWDRRRKRAEALVQRALRHEQSGREDEALARVRELLELDPENEAGRDLQRRIEERRAERERERLQRIAASLENARSANREADYETTVIAARDVLESDPENVEAKHLAQSAEAKLGALSRGKQEVAHRLNEGERLVSRGAEDEATEAFNETMRLARSLLEDFESDAELKDMVERAGAALGRLRMERAVRELLDEADERAKESLRSALDLVTGADSAVAEHPDVQAAVSRYRSRLEAQQRERELAALLETATQALERGEYQACLETTDRILALQDEHGEALTLRSRAQEGIDRQRREKSAYGALEAARAAVQAESMEEAERELERARRASLESDEFQRRCDELEDRVAELRDRLEARREAERVLVEARKLLKLKTLAEARHRLARAETLWPQAPELPKLRRKLERLEGGRSPWLLYAKIAFVAALLVLSFRWLRPALEEWSSSDSADSIIEDVGPSDPDSPNVEARIAEIESALNSKDYSRAVELANGTLDAAPGNERALDLLGEANAVLERIDADIRRVENAVAGGDTETAAQILDELSRIAGPNTDLDPLFEQLNATFRDRAAKAREEMQGVKSRAAAANAAELAGDSERLAAQSEQQAERLFTESRYGEATGKFREASDLYERAAREAARESERRAEATLREEAMTAQSRFADARAGASELGAERFAEDSFRRAEQAADAAAEHLQSGDFESAATGFERASELMAGARDLASRELAEARSRVEAAAREMESVKARAGEAPDAAAEESRAKALRENGDLAGAAAAYARASELYALAAERRDVLRVVQEYETAYESLDLAAVRRVFPSSPDRLEQTFKNLRSISLEMRPVGEPTVAGNSASVSYQVSQSVVAQAGNQRMDESYEATFHLERAADGWRIARVARVR